MNATIRHVATAVGLIIKGGIENAEFGPDTTQEEYERQVFLAVARELSDWLEAEPDIAAECALELTRRHGDSE